MLVVDKTRFIVQEREIVTLLLTISFNDVDDDQFNIQVYYMFDFLTNLLFISIFAKRKIFWSNENYVLKYKSTFIVYISLHYNDLYAMKLRKHQMITLSIKFALSFFVWHRRLDHSSYSILRRYFIKLKHNFQDDCKNNHCEICKLIKIKKEIQQTWNTSCRKIFSHDLHWFYFDYYRRFWKRTLLYNLHW